MNTLNDLALGKSAKVTKIGGDGNLRYRVMNMGITRGTTVKLLKKAPFGDPLEILVRGYHLSLRKHEAATIEIGGNQ